MCWRLTVESHRALAPLRERLGEETYAASTKALQNLLCDYFNTGSCTGPGLNINPMGGTANGGKCFKVRWAVPGCGKSGGLRIALVAFCNAREVVVCDAWDRRDDPTSGEFATAFVAATRT